MRDSRRTYPGRSPGRASSLPAVAWAAWSWIDPAPVLAAAGEPQGVGAEPRGRFRRYPGTAALDGDRQIEPGCLSGHGIGVGRRLLLALLRQILGNHVIEDEAAPELR